MGRELDFLTAARDGDAHSVGKFLKLATKHNGPLASFRRNFNINFQDLNKYTALHYACLYGHINIVRQLLEHNACVDERDKSGSTPLFLASWAGQHEIVEMLLSNSPSANPNVQTCKNETPLHASAQHGYGKVVHLLLRYGADPYIRNDAFQTPLDLGAQYGHLQVVKILLRSEPNLVKQYRRSCTDSEEFNLPNTATSSKQFFTQTCLHLASCNGHNEIVQTLLESGVDVNILTSAGSALHAASLHGKKLVVVTLLKAGINVLATNKDGRTALEELSKFPPQCTHDIVTIITEFMLSKKNLVQVTQISSKQCLEKNKGLNKYYKQKDQQKHRKKQDKPIGISKSLSSLDATPNPPANYLEMKPVKHLKSFYGFNSMGQIYRPFYKEGSLSGITKDLTPFESCSSLSPSYENLKANSSKEHTTNNSGLSQYEEMFTYSPVTDYEFMLVNNSEHSTSTNLSSCGIDSNNNNFTKQWSRHSPTPDYPPPTVNEAVSTISSYMQQVSTKQDNLDTGASTSKTNSICSDVVEKFVGDIPFAGLFKGSTQNLTQDLVDGRDAGLRSPSMVSTVSKLNQRRSPSQIRSIATGENCGASRLWDEIAIIFEQINDEMFSAEQESHVNGEPAQQEKANEESEHNQANNKQRQSLHIRNPNKLLLGKSQSTAAHWCHSPYTLAYGKICYPVFYLGSTVIRHLQGTISARKSIQKLKIVESLKPAASDSDLLANCNTSTKYLKAVNLETRLKVEIAASCHGVQFIDFVSKTAICSHNIENISCVCQDASDLRYFAYLTKEQDMHYCHVFMVDRVELANEIILTLGQAFEVAYQLAISR